MLVRRLMKSRMQALQAQPSLTVRGYGDRPDEKPENYVPYESPNIITKDRFDDEAPPGEDEMIKAHYLKHHPFYEFKHYDSY